MTTQPLSPLTMLLSRHTRRRRRDQPWRATCATPLNADCLFRRALARQRRCCLVVALLARQQRLQSNKLVVVVERNEVLLAGRERVAALEQAHHVANALRRREQRDRREGHGENSGGFEIL